MQTFVDISKNCACVDRQDALFYLIKIYVTAKDIDSALNVLTRYKEEMLTPRPSTLQYLSNACRLHNIEVPFEEPSVNVKKSNPINTNIHLHKQDHPGLAGELNVLHEIEDFWKYLESRNFNVDEIIFIRNNLPDFIDRESYYNLNVYISIVF